MADAPKTPKLLKVYTMPVDPAVFSGVPSVTALKPLLKANVLLAAAMDRRVVCLDLAAEPPPVPEAEKEKKKDEVQPIVARHMLWAHDHWIHDLDVHPDGERV